MRNEYLIACRAADSTSSVACRRPDAPVSLSLAFVERFRRIAGRVPQSSDAMSHDALLLLAAAVRDVGPSRVAIRDYLRALGRERAPYPGVTGPISFRPDRTPRLVMARLVRGAAVRLRSEEHTSELQSPCNLVCRLLLEKKNSGRAQRQRCKYKRFRHSH